PAPDAIARGANPCAGTRTGRHREGDGRPDTPGL
ncbi:MAG: hypothetical protein AVDCRST_MAG69-212, partial [uncultured Solirubrobacteraceae bacterium]